MAARLAWGRTGRRILLEFKQFRSPGPGVRQYLNEYGFRIPTALDEVAGRYSSTPARVAAAPVALQSAGESRRVCLRTDGDRGRACQGPRASTGPDTMAFSHGGRGRRVPGQEAY